MIRNKEMNNSNEQHHMTKSASDTYLSNHLNQSAHSIKTLSSLKRKGSSNSIKDKESSQNGKDLGDVNKIFNSKRHLNIVSRKKHFKWVVIGGSLLSYNAGYINGITYGGTFSVPTAHVTGYATNLAMQIVKESHVDAFLFATLWFTFMFGSFLSALLVPFESFKITRCYARSLSCIGLSIFVAFLLGTYFPDKTYYLYFCSLGCGLQNAMTTRYSGNVIRTTHLSGTTTDIGIIIGHMVRGRYKEYWKLELYIPMCISYVLGSICGYEAYLEWGFTSLLVSVGITTLVGVKHALIVSGLYKRKFWKVFLGIPDVVHRTARNFGQSMRNSKFSKQSENQNRDVNVNGVAIDEISNYSKSCSPIKEEILGQSVEEQQPLSILKEDGSSQDIELGNDLTLGKSNDDIAELPNNDNCDEENGEGNFYDDNYFCEDEEDEEVEEEDDTDDDENYIYTYPQEQNVDGLRRIQSAGNLFSNIVDRLSLNYSASNPNLTSLDVSTPQLDEFKEEKLNNV